jgi:hypothetical protein
MKLEYAQICQGITCQQTRLEKGATYAFTGGGAFVRRGVLTVTFVDGSTIDFMEPTGGIEVYTPTPERGVAILAQLPVALGNVYNGRIHWVGPELPIHQSRLEDFVQEDGLLPEQKLGREFIPLRLGPQPGNRDSNPWQSAKAAE